MRKTAGLVRVNRKSGQAAIGLRADQVTNREIRAMLTAVICQVLASMFVIQHPGETVDAIDTVLNAARKLSRPDPYQFSCNDWMRERDKELQRIAICRVRND